MIEAVLHGRFASLARSLSEHGLLRRRFRQQPISARHTAFIYYPPTDYVEGQYDGYPDARQYFYYHKRGQRRVLQQHFDVAPEYTECDPPWIIRGVRHHAGRNFFVAHNERDLRQIPFDDWYGVGLFRRTREFRSFFVGGEHIRTCLKRIDGAGYAEREDFPDVDDDALQLSPWNRRRMGTEYLTISSERNNKLLETSFFDDAASFFEERPLDFVAIDTGYNDHTGEYVVFETNFAPSLTIESALVPIADAIKELR